MKQRRKNPVSKDLRTPKYRMRVEKNKKAYNRKRDKNNFSKVLYILRVFC